MRTILTIIIFESFAFCVGILRPLQLNEAWLALILVMVFVSTVFFMGILDYKAHINETEE